MNLCEFWPKYCNAENVGAESVVQITLKPGPSQNSNNVIIKYFNIAKIKLKFVRMKKLKNYSKTVFDSSKKRLDAVNATQKSSVPNKIRCLKKSRKISKKFPFFAVLAKTGILEGLS